MLAYRIVALGLALLQVVFCSRSAVGADLPLEGAVIVVDAGHGGQRYSKSYTGGTRGVFSRLTESELNLRVALELASLLKADGATVFMTRVADHRLSPEGSTNKDELHARIDFVEHHNCHFFLSVHHNAGRPTATGHTALYKHNATDDTLYESLARCVNDSLEGVVPGPKVRLIKGNYHILRETAIPGTISEAGYMTNKAFDEICNRPDYAGREATAIRDGAVRYWTGHKEALVKHQDHLARARAQAEQPRDPATITAIDLNPAFQSRMRDLLQTVAPEGGYTAEKAGDYVTRFRHAVVTDPAAEFTVTAEFRDGRIHLTGTTSDVRYHNQLIDMFVAMKLYDIANEIALPPEEGQAVDKDAKSD